MKIFKSSLFALMEDGKIGLLVPAARYRINIERDVYGRMYGNEIYPEDALDCEEIPDDWLIKLKQYRPAVGKESGFYYFTEKGWKENKEKIKEIYEHAVNSGHDRGQTWADFEKYAEKHFGMVRKKTQKYIDQLESKIKELKSIKL